MVAISGARLNRELARRHLSQADLARLCGLPEGTISRIANGRPPRQVTLRRIAEALASVPVDVTVDALLDVPSPVTA